MQSNLPKFTQLLRDRARKCTSCFSPKSMVLNARHLPAGVGKEGFVEEECRYLFVH